MNKKDLINRATDLLQQLNARKKVRAQKCTFYISDEEGNSSEFVIKKDSRAVLFTMDDVGEIFDALLSVIIDAIKDGEEVAISGFGSFNVHKRAERIVKHPDTGEIVPIDAHYVTKFVPGKDLRLAAKIYDLATKESEVEDSKLVDTYSELECD